MADDIRTTSILTSIKKMLGLSDDYTEFDLDITMLINGVFATLNQLAVGPTRSFFIMDKTPTWGDFLGEQQDINSVVSYMFYKVKLAFDPPPTSFAITSMENMAKETEWRLNVVMENVLRPPFDGSGLTEGVYLGNRQWNLTGGLEFPPQAKVGDVGIDYESGNVWRKS